VNRCAAPGLRTNGKLPVDEFQPLLHARQSEPTPSRDLLRVEANPGILDGQLDVIDSTFERRLEVSRAAVFDRILQCFLQHAEDTQRNHVWEFLRNVFGGKVDLYLLLIGQFLAQAGRRRFEPQVPASKSEGGVTTPEDPSEAPRPLDLLAKARP
jgi:hypothetical protein